MRVTHHCPSQEGDSLECVDRQVSTSPSAPSMGEYLVTLEDTEVTSAA
ncbi:hypothetical protein FHS90_001581 [Rufibacter quisquiliarum]|uniref:Uncharacterized protein n=1 Tax=Rufibacter quisquiliarum TaxID=1549639 RepID=A0A839GGZ8_9BACT|nr:hypothetical protein [Rufibacter quisquiliarum]